MRQEDKEVDGPEIEQAEEKKRETELVEEREDELYDLDGLPETTLDSERATGVLSAMKEILAGGQLVINDLKLPKRQLVALEALRSAVEGKDQQLSRFMYAEDRRTLLEQALAVLQPEIASMQGTGGMFEDMISKVGSLREKLNVLEDSEEELVEGRAHDYAKDGNDTDDKPDDSDLDDPKPKPAKPKKAKPKGEGDKDLSLTGPERPQEPKGPSTLEQPERPQAPKGPTTLEAPERPLEPKGPTTLGDPDEISKVAENEPRWRRSGG